jgi:tRNA pseudouridine38-40 synthase
MIRNIVGALIYVGSGRLNVTRFQELLRIGDRTKSPPTFMPDGLYLAYVDYGNKIFSYAPNPLYNIL